MIEQKPLSTSNGFSLICILLLSACKMLSCFCIFLSPIATNEVLCKAAVDVRARELQDGYRLQQGSSFFSSAAHQSCMVWPYNTLIPPLSLFLSFSVAFLHFLFSSSCQENTQLTALWRGQGSLFVLVLLCFTAGLHKTTVHEQLPPHTNTHACWHADITSVSRCSYTEYKKKKSLFICFFGGGSQSNAGCVIARRHRFLAPGACLD